MYKRQIQYGVKEYLLKPVMEEEMEEVLIRLEKERKQSEKNYSVPEISGYTAAQEEFTGGRFLVTSFYMPEIKDEVQRRERIFKLYHILSAHTEKMCIRDRLAAYAGQNSPYYGRLYKGCLLYTSGQASGAAPPRRTEKEFHGSGGDRAGRFQSSCPAPL